MQTSFSWDLPLSWILSIFKSFYVFAKYFYNLNGIVFKVLRQYFPLKRYKLKTEYHLVLCVFLESPNNYLNMFVVMIIEYLTSYYRCKVKRNKKHIELPL